MPASSQPLDECAPTSPTQMTRDFSPKRTAHGRNQRLRCETGLFWRRCGLNARAERQPNRRGRLRVQCMQVWWGRERKAVGLNAGMIPAAQSSEEGVDEWMAGMWDLDARAIR
jgi:hypothetical protein